MAVFKHLLVATDFSETSEQAVQVTLELTRESGAELTVLHTAEIPSSVYAGQTFAVVDLMQPIIDVAQQKLDAFMRSVRERHPRAHGVLKLGVAWEQILAGAAEVHADLIVIGTHGRRGIAHAVLGSVAERVVRLSPVPVLTVRGRTHGTDAGAGPAGP